MLQDSSISLDLHQSSLSPSRVNLDVSLHFLEGVGDDPEPDFPAALNRRIGPCTQVSRPDSVDDQIVANWAVPESSESESEDNSSPSISSWIPELPGYEILGELGRGGMGVVYKARQVHLNRIVAIKMILAGAHASVSEAARFRAEAETVAQLQHPNIVQIHALGEWEGCPYVELEYVPGGSLAARLDGTPWEPRAAARLMETLARAIHEAHLLGIVHRDLKPANILMGQDGVPKITDFGLAKSLERDSKLTRTESVLGSPCYMAPEQAEGHASEVGPAADVYVLGAALYELLSGRPPFRASTVMGTLDLVRHADPVPPSRLIPGLPRDIETICLKCLNKSQDKRYQSAEALADDLGRFLRMEPILARPAHPGERVWKWVRRRPTTAALVAFCALASLGAFSSVHAFRANVREQREQARLHIARLGGQASQYLLLGREAIRRGDWVSAKSHFDSAMALTKTERKLDRLYITVAEEARINTRRLAELSERRDAQALLQSFVKHRDRATFYQSQYTGLDPEANTRATRDAAQTALKLIRFDPDREDSRPDLRGLSQREREQVLSDAYELSLTFADAVSQTLPTEDPLNQARKALAILGKASIVCPPTRAFHRRRATFLQRLGLDKAARTETNLAEAASSTRSAGDEFLQGEECLARHEHDTAIDHFKHALTLQPDHFWAQYLLAICQLKSRRLTESQVTLIACQARRPDFVWIYLLKGFAEGELHEFDLAETDFLYADALRPDDATRYVLLVNRGVVRIRQGRYAEAETDLHGAVALKPDHFQAYLNLAQAYQAQESWDEASVAINRAIELCPEEGVLFRARAQIALDRDDDESALRDFESASSLATHDDPERANDCLEKARILQRRHQPKEALACCEAAIKIQPGLRAAQRLRGILLMDLKRFNDAVRAFDACLADGPAAPMLYEARGLSKAWKGAYAEAISDYTLALQGGRNTVSARINRGWAYLFTGAPQLAESDFREAVRLASHNCEALSGLALAEAQLRHFPRAEADAQVALAQNPTDPRTIYNVARAYCLIADGLESEPTPGTVRDVLNRHRERAVNLIRRALSFLPESERSGFWRDVVRPDTTLGPIRQLSSFRLIESEYGRPVPVGPGPHTGVQTP